MKFAIIVPCGVLPATLALARPGDGHYIDSYDNVNLDEFLSNKRLLLPHIKS